MGRRAARQFPIFPTFVAPRSSRPCRATLLEVSRQDFAFCLEAGSLELSSQGCLLKSIDFCLFFAVRMAPAFSRNSLIEGCGVREAGDRAKKKTFRHKIIGI